MWDENLDEIHAQVMGEVQIEILKTMIKERFGVYVEFGEGNIVYKETILESVEESAILNLCGTTLRSICCWNRVRRAAACSLGLPAVRGYPG